MKVICAWCKVVLQDGDEPISHGICGSCAEQFVLKDLRKVGIGE